MGIRDELTASFGEDFWAPTASQVTKQNWHGLCVCGHLDRYHSPTVGGTYQLKESDSIPWRGQTYQRNYVLDGCVGALKRRNAEVETVSTDHDAKVMVYSLNVTCPCDNLRVVATVDRPSRFFNQQIANDTTLQARHPFMVGIRAFSTHLSRRKAATGKPDWADEEFDRRFTWGEDVRHCSISHCLVSGTDVWPTFVNGELLSELRCGAHRRP